jgi:hypothetical protein
VGSASTWGGRAMAGRPYLYIRTMILKKGHDLVLMIARKSLHEAGFEPSSKPTEWEQFGANQDTLVLVTCVARSSSDVYVQVTAVSNADDSAKKWMADIAHRIETSKLVKFD